MPKTRVTAASPTRPIIQRRFPQHRQADLPILTTLPMEARAVPTVANTGSNTGSASQTNPIATTTGPTIPPILTSSGWSFANWLALVGMPTKKPMMAACQGAACEVEPRTKRHGRTFPHPRHEVYDRVTTGERRCGSTGECGVDARHDGRILTHVWDIDARDRNVECRLC